MPPQPGQCRQHWSTWEYQPEQQPEPQPVQIPKKGTAEHEQKGVTIPSKASPKWLPFSIPLGGVHCVNVFLQGNMLGRCFIVKSASQLKYVFNQLVFPKKTLWCLSRNAFNCCLALLCAFWASARALTKSLSASSFVGDIDRCKLTGPV